MYLGVIRMVTMMSLLVKGTFFHAFKIGHKSKQICWILGVLHNSGGECTQPNYENQTM